LHRGAQAGAGGAALDAGQHERARICRARLALAALDAYPSGDGLSAASALAWFGARREVEMDWNRVEGNWKQVKGKIKEQWGKLTDDDLNVINGRRDQLEGKIQERYGYAKDQVRKEVDDWYTTQRW
jgi:uncharacterized protein YjbJ (UPF0337 family)